MQLRNQHMGVIAWVPDDCGAFGVCWRSAPCRRKSRRSQSYTQGACDGGCSSRYHVEEAQNIAEEQWKQRRKSSMVPGSGAFTRE